MPLSGSSYTYAKQIFVLAQTIQVTTTERQSAKVLVDHAEEVLG